MQPSALINSLRNIFISPQKFYTFYNKTAPDWHEWKIIFYYYRKSVCQSIISIKVCVHKFVSEVLSEVCIAFYPSLKCVIKYIFTTYSPSNVPRESLNAELKKNFYGKFTSFMGRFLLLHLPTQLLKTLLYFYFSIWFSILGRHWYAHEVPRVEKSLIPFNYSTQVHRNSAIKRRIIYCMFITQRFKQMWRTSIQTSEWKFIENMFGEVCSNFTYNFHWNNETFVFDHELECTVSRTVFVLFSFIGIAGLVGNALVVLGECRQE